MKHTILIFDKTPSKKGFCEYDNDDFYLRSNGEWEIWEHDLKFDFSRPKILSYIGKKAEYAIASLCSRASDEDRKQYINEITLALQKKEPKLKKICLPKCLQNWYIVYHNDLQVTENCLTTDLLKNFLKDNGVTLEDFLLDRRYVIILDQDNQTLLQKLGAVGLLTKNTFRTYSG